MDYHEANGARPPIQNSIFYELNDILTSAQGVCPIKYYMQSSGMIKRMLLIETEAAGVARESIGLTSMRSALHGEEKSVLEKSRKIVFQLPLFKVSLS